MCDTTTQVKSLQKIPCATPRARPTPTTTTTLLSSPLYLPVFNSMYVESHRYTLRTFLRFIRATVYVGPSYCCVIFHFRTILQCVFASFCWTLVLFPLGAIMARAANNHLSYAFWWIHGLISLSFLPGGRVAGSHDRDCLAVTDTNKWFSRAVEPIYASPAALGALGTHQHFEYFNFSLSMGLCYSLIVVLI